MSDLLGISSARMQVHLHVKCHCVQERTEHNRNKGSTAEVCRVLLEISLRQPHVPPPGIGFHILPFDMLAHKLMEACIFSFFFLKNLFLLVLGIPCCVGFSLIVVSEGYFLVAVYW